MIRKRFLLSFLALSLITPNTQTGMLNTLGFTLDTSLKDIFATRDQRITAVIMATVFWMGYIRLKTKRTDKSGTIYNWQDLLKVWNITSSEYWKTFDALVIGEPLKLIEISKTEKDETGNVVKLKDKSVKNTPKGVLGLIDAYVIIQLKNVIENIKNIDWLWDKTTSFINKGTIININEK